MNNKPTYLSREGEATLRLELEQLANVRRFEVAARIHDAKEQGGLSENAEYEEAKNEQAFVEGRIQTLEGMLKTAVIIEHSDSGHVAIGSSVTVESDDGEETFAIVGSAQARPAQGRNLEQIAGRPRPARQDGGRHRRREAPERVRRHVYDHLDQLIARPDGPGRAAGAATRPGKPERRTQGCTGRTSWRRRSRDRRSSTT